MRGAYKMPKKKSKKDSENEPKEKLENEFKNAFNIVKEILKNQKIDISIEDYDGIAVNKLAASNTLDDGRISTNQTHIAIPKKQMDMFPYLGSEGYFSGAYKDINYGSKTYFIAQVPVFIMKTNIEYLKDETSDIDIEFNGDTKKRTLVCIVKSRRDGQSDQIQISRIEDDSQEFIAFRKLIHINDYLVILKKKEVLEYEFYGVKNKDEKSEKSGSLEELSKKFFYKATNTCVDISNTFFNNNINYNIKYKSDYHHNRILFGAPGTGKSFKINSDKDELLFNGGEYERVTFHPDYSYANFVGTYKPVPCKDSEGNKTITYEYVPGPFMRTLVKALKNSSEKDIKPYLLIIEEINRANVAAVFGDVFQLLDRDDNNVSEYPITTSRDMRNYLSKELGGNPNDYSEIKIPDNMFIWATMNSADQGVFPMDTAFKRRWDFTYLGIDDSEDGIKGKKVILGKGTHATEVEWNELRKAINETLAGYNVNEDKLLGPYFISKKIISDEIDAEKFIDIFKSKVIMYLFDDAAKQKRQTLFSGCKEKSNQYSKICKEFEDKGIKIFCESIREKFLKTEVSNDGE
jgi:hypothetical protein